MVEAFTESTGVLIRDLNRLADPKRSVEVCREDVTAFIADAIQFGLTSDVYNAILGALIGTAEDRVAMPYLSPTHHGRVRFARPISDGNSPIVSATV